MLAAEVTNAAVPLQVTLRVLYQTLGAAVYVLVYRLVYPQSARELVQSRVSAALDKARAAQRDTLEAFVRFARIEAARAAAAVAAAHAAAAADVGGPDGPPTGTVVTRVTFAANDMYHHRADAEGASNAELEPEPVVDTYVLRARSIAQRRLQRGHAEDDHDGDVTSSEGGYLHHHVSFHSSKSRRNLLTSSKRLADAAAAVERGFSSAVQLPGSQGKAAATTVPSAAPLIANATAAGAAAGGSETKKPAAAGAATDNDTHYDPTPALQSISGILSSLPALLMDAAAEPKLFGSPFSRLQRRYDAVLGGLRRVSRAVASVHEATMGLRAQAMAHSAELPLQLAQRQQQLRNTLIEVGALSVRPGGPAAANETVQRAAAAAYSALSPHASGAIGVIASPDRGSGTAPAPAPVQAHPPIHPELHIALPHCDVPAEGDAAPGAGAAIVAVGAAAELSSEALGAVPVDDVDEDGARRSRSGTSTSSSLRRGRAATDAAATVAPVAAADAAGSVAAADSAQVSLSQIPSAARGALALGELLPAIAAVGSALSSVLRYVCTVAAPDKELLLQIKAAQARRSAALQASSTRRSTTGAASGRQRGGSLDFAVDPSSSERAPMTPVAEDDELVLATDDGSGGLGGSGSGDGDGAGGGPLKPAQAARMRAMTLLPAAVADMTNALHAVTAGFNALLLAQAHGAAGYGAVLAGAVPSPSASVSAAILPGATGGAGAVPASSAAVEDSAGASASAGLSSGSGLIFTNLQELCVGTFTFALQELVEAAAELALAVRRLWHAQGDPFGSLRV